MARKLSGFQRVLDAPALFSVAYGEIASSLYFALGIVAAYALGFTPLVLLGAGIFFLLVSLSYAEGTAALPETGGAATFVRRAYNDVYGFLTGWALFLDYLIVIALSAVFLPHYLGTALGVEALRESPWDLVVAVTVILAIATVRLVRRSQLHSAGLVVAGLDLATQLLLLLLGLALLVSPDALTQGTNLGVSPSWDDLAFALPLAMLAYTGLETVANLAEETREPGRTLPRSLFSAIGLVVLLTAGVAAVGLSAFPVENGETALGEEWLKAPLAGIVEALSVHVPDLVGDALVMYVGLTGALVLLAAATTSMSGFTRLAHSLGEHRQLPASFGRLNRRTLVSPQAIVAVATRLDRPRDRHRTDDRRRRLPREPLLVRGPPRLRGRAARGDPPPLHRARPATAVPGAARGAADRGAARDRVLARRDRHAPGRALCRAGLAGARPRSLPRRPPPRAHRAPGGSFSGPGAARRCRVQARARADEARADRGGDGCDCGRAGEGARRPRRRALRDRRVRSTRSWTRRCSSRRSRRPPRSRKPSSSARRTAFASSP